MKGAPPKISLVDQFEKSLLENGAEAVCVDPLTPQLRPRRLASLTCLSYARRMFPLPFKVASPQISLLVKFEKSLLENGAEAVCVDPLTPPLPQHHDLPPHHLHTTATPTPSLSH